MFLNSSLARKTYLSITVAITIPILLFGWMESKNTERILLSEKELILFKISSTLEQKLPASFHEILEQQNALTLSEPEKVLVLNKRLQIIIDEVAKAYPGYGMGYAIHSQRIAFHPFTEELLFNPIGARPLQIYETKTVCTFFNEPSYSWGNASVMFLGYPVFYDGEMIGHIWANTKMDELNSAIYLAWIKNLSILFMVWLVLILFIRKAFLQIGKGLNELTEQILLRDDNSSNLSFPELKPLLETVIHLREEVIIKERNELLLKQKEAQLLNACPIPILEVSQDGSITSLNDATYSIFKKYLPYNRQELLGRSFRDLADAAGIQYEDLNIDQVLHKGQNVINKHIKQTNEEWLFTGTALRDPQTDEVTGAIGVFLDITEYERLRVEMMKLDRLNIVGEVASSVAHEVRNPATTIRGFVQLLNQKMGSTYHEHFQIILDELDRMNSIIDDFLSLARNKTVEKTPMSLNHLLLALKPLLEADTLKNDIQLQYNLTKEIGLTLINPKEIRQLVMNLARNSIEAMQPKGALTISTESYDEYVKLTIADTGCGITDEELQHIFTPFYTSKTQGTGLGLPVCKNIVDGHNGRIEVQSEVGKGTSFAIFLPLL